MDEPRWLTIARGEVGVHETPGLGSTERVDEYLSTVGLSDDVNPWCAAFVGWILQQAALTPTGKANARSYLAWGQHADPRVGAIAVFRRGNTWQGHVAFVTAVEPDRLQILGGNQHDAVCIEWFPRQKLLDTRWPAGEALS